VVQVYEDFSTVEGADGPDRFITPAEDDSQISVNLHGIFVSGGDLYLTDVGDAASNEDGQIFVMEDPESASGVVNVDERIEGASTGLGNPVDIVVVGNVAYVAEKSNDMVKVYDRGTLGLDDLGIR